MGQRVHWAIIVSAAAGVFLYLRSSSLRPADLSAPDPMQRISDNGAPLGIDASSSPVTAQDLRDRLARDADDLGIQDTGALPAPKGDDEPPTE